MVWNVLNITYIRKMYCAERPMLFYWLRIRLADFQLWQSRFVDVLSVSLLDSYHLIPLPVTLLDLHVVSIQKIYQTLEIIHFQHLLSQTIPSTSSFVTNTSLSVVFSILLSLFAYPNETLSLMFDILRTVLPDCVQRAAALREMPRIFRRVSTL